MGCHLLPNTAGCKSANEVYTLAQMSREIFGTDWIKLEVIGDDYNLQPDPVELLNAAEMLIKDGFKVLPYCTDDLVICAKDCMIWGARLLCRGDRRLGLDWG